MTVYPGSIDNIQQPGPNDVTNVLSHAGTHDSEIQAIQAIETKLGTGASTATNGTVLTGTGTGSSTWQAFPQVSLTTGVTGTLPVANGGTGVTTSTGSGNNVLSTSPAITTPTGIVKGDVGLGNVDNTSDATKNAATVSLTNHTITSSTNNISAVTFTNPYKFSVYLNTDTTITNTTLKVPFDTKEFDTGGNFDVVTNHRFTVPVSGFYQVDLQVQIGSAGMGTTENCYIQLYKNGAAYLTGQKMNGNSDSQRLIIPRISKLIQLSASDYLEVYAAMVGSRDITNGLSVTFFSGFLVSAT